MLGVCVCLTHVYTVHSACLYGARSLQKAVFTQPLSLVDRHIAKPRLKNDHNDPHLLRTGAIAHGVLLL